VIRKRNLSEDKKIIGKDEKDLSKDKSEPNVKKEGNPYKDSTELSKYKKETPPINIDKRRFICSPNS